MCSNLLFLLPVWRFIHSEELNGVTVTIHLLVCHFVCSNNATFLCMTSRANV